MDKLKDLIEKKIKSAIKFKSVFNNAPKPLFFSPKHQINFEQEFSHFLEETNISLIKDEYSDQLKELFFLRNPSLEEDSKEAIKKLRSFLIERVGVNKGAWVYYPWTGNLLHILEPELFQEVRTARNKYLLTSEEQKQFQDFIVGIAGLSIGNSVALTLAYSGGSSTMKLADPDEFSLSNLNRVRVPIHYVGVKKVYVAAQQIYEINPYANLILYPEGVNGNNLEDFLTGEPKINLVIEEMDNLKLKIFIRLAARAAKLPLLMTTDNGDNAIIDVERYDQDKSGTPLDVLPEMQLKDVVEGIDFGEQLNLTKDEKVRFATNIVGPKNVAPRMQESLMEVGKSIASWPQLGTAAFLGGAALTFAIKKIALGEDIRSGKTHISLDKALIENFSKDAKKRDLETEKFRKYIGNLTDNASSNYSVWATDEKKFPQNSSMNKKLKFVLNYALMAPSAHNTQPWKFKITDNKILIYIEPDRHLTVSDPAKRELYIGLGAMLANLKIALEYFGFGGKTILWPSNIKDCFAEITVSEVGRRGSELLGAIAKRYTDRSIFSGIKLAGDIIRKIKALAKGYDLRLNLIEDYKTKDAVSNLMITGSEEIMKVSPFREELSRWLRHNFTNKFDGIPGNVLGLDDIQSIISPFLIRNYNMGKNQAQSDKQAILSSSCLVVISSNKDNKENWVQVGELYEKILLLTTKYGIKSGTFASLVELEPLNKKLKSILKIKERPQAFFRLGYSDSKIPHTPRYPVEKVLM